MSPQTSSGSFFKFSLGGNSLIFVGIVEISLLGGMVDSPFLLFRFCGFGFVGFIDFLCEDWLERVTLSGKSIVKVRVLPLHNLLR